MTKSLLDQFRIALITPDFGNPSAEELRWIAENQVPTPNRVVETFERQLGDYAGRHAMATASGTAALHLALATLGIGPGDEVICSDFTFAATINAILYAGAKPCLIDAEGETWGMDPELLRITLARKAKQGKLPKAVILTHVLGHPANLPEIIKLCRAYHVFLIEDAAGSLGSRLEDQPLGTWGDIGVWSFNYNKILSTGGGGAMITEVDSFIDRAKYLSTQAKSNKSFYFHKELGYNYRINGFGAGMGAVLWPDLASRVSGKQRVRKAYEEALADLPVTWQGLLPKAEGNYWLNGLLLPNVETRQRVQDLLKAERIECGRLWKPMHQQPAYARCAYVGSGTGDTFFDLGIALPSDANLSQEEVEEVCYWVKQGCNA